ncbi:acetyltransferase [Histoplasma capsulatum G186AR]|uniref:Acetyltransferase n=1 Tax=Ajellomyces capsulatus TaxID=5037 RepID=A0A8H8D545_AJECA|nr:acetyltransferase [Histoplasma capsulatum]QSS67248.1 acetyltransferase [Histoplasma capsulatum G186AR]
MSIPVIHKQDKPQSSLLPLLSTHLPHSGPLFRRIQHSLSYPSKTAQILATFPSTPESEGVKAPSLWLAAYVDVYVGNDTQIWLYSSVEAEASLPSIQERSATEEQLSGLDQLSELVLEPTVAAELLAQLLSLFLYIRTHIIPPYISYLGSQSNEANQPPNPSPYPGKSSKRPPPHLPTSFKIGSVHTGIYDLLLAAIAAPEKIPPHLPRIRVLSLDAGACMKYLFHRSTYNSFPEKPAGASGTNGTNDDKGLPPGYRLHDLNRRAGVQKGHLDLVLSRLDIPRSKELLLQMPSVAVYHDGEVDNVISSCSGATANSSSGRGVEEMPVAWCFLNVDASLCSLHVEEEHRRRGLANVIAREVMKLGLGDDGGVFTSGTGSDIGAIPKGKRDDDHHDHGWAFSDVFLQNTASRRAMRKLGGEPAGTVKWVVVDVVDVVENH